MERVRRRSEAMTNKEERCPANPSGHPGQGFGTEAPFNPFDFNLEPFRSRLGTDRVPSGESTTEIPAWTGEDNNPPAICWQPVEQSCGSCQSFSQNQSSPASGRGLCMKDPPPGETLRLPGDGKDCPGYHGAGTATNEHKPGVIQAMQDTPSSHCLDSSDPVGRDEPTTRIPGDAAVPPFMREHWRDQAMKLYEDLPASLPPERGRELAAIHLAGWTDWTNWRANIRRDMTSGRIARL